MNQSLQEKRRQTRQSIRALCFVRLSSKKRTKQLVGSLADISWSGLAFTFLPEKEYTGQDPEADETYLVDLFLSGGSGFVLSDVPAQIKYKVEKKEALSFLGMSLERCGMQFRDLSENQQNELTQLLATSYPV